MNLLDLARAIVCSLLGHRIVERTDGQRWCARCKRFVTLL